MPFSVVCPAQHRVRLWQMDKPSSLLGFHLRRAGVELVKGPSRALGVPVKFLLQRVRQARAAGQDYADSGGHAEQE